MSLRARLLGLVLLAALLPALLLGWRFFRESESEIAEAVNALASAADNVSSDLEHRIQGTAQLHYGLAYSAVLDHADRAACSAYLSQVREAYPQYTGLLTVRPDGQLHCDSLQSGRVLNLSDRSYVKRSVAGETGLILEPAFGRLTGTAVLQIVLPARTYSGSLRFMLVASLNLQKFSLDAQKQLPLHATQLLLVDTKGIVMAWTGGKGLPPPGSSVADSAVFGLARLHREGGTGELIGRDGRQQVWAVATSPSLATAGLRLMLGVSRDELVAASKLRLRHGLLVLAAAALLLFAGVWWLVEWGIRRHVLRITAMVRNLGAGNLSARIGHPYPRGELGGLMEVLDTTADSLQRQREAIDDLDKRLRQAHARELSEREQNEARLTHIANFDGLTGMPNRSLFRDRLQQAMARARRNGRALALIFLDLDRFKTINDSLGHGVGDQLLVAVSEILSLCVRDTDSIGRPAEDALTGGPFRVGGDEFTILVEDLLGTDSVTLIAKRILAALDRPFVVGEHELFISASIGITVYDGDNLDLDGLIKQADMAMYRSKHLGRDTYFFFDEAMNKEASNRHELETKLRRALERNEFLLHYQPKADLKTGRVTGVEALLRWKPPGEALVGPDQFIPMLEETGLIVAVGAWIFREACEQLVEWQRFGLRPINLAVNLSARQFRHQDLVDHIARVLAQTGLEASRLEVELTESMLIDDSESVLSILAGLDAMGVRVAIDDFGTGHSSLSYLKRFNLDTLKIDRSFINGTPGNSEDSAIATAVIALGHGLRLKVVAEGVETREQAYFLRDQGCDEFQGYWLSRPIDGKAFAQWFAQHEACEDRIWLQSDSASVI